MDNDNFNMFSGYPSSDSPFSSNWSASALEDLLKGETIGRRVVLDLNTMQYREERPSDDPESVIPMTSHDLGHSASTGWDTRFQRAKGLLETDELRVLRAAIFGVGSMGGRISELLVQSGVGSIYLVDDDVLEEGNLMRHCAGMRDVGRYKVEATKDRLLDKNPEAEVIPKVLEVSGVTVDAVTQIVAESDFVVVAFDRPKPRFILNAICVAQNKPCFMPGAMSRAHALQVLIVNPRQGPCYLCFRDSLRKEARQVEPAHRSDREQVAYSDVPNVPIEPGLAIDLEPAANLVARLVVVRAMRGRPSTLHSVDEDLSAPLYLWVNRREPGSVFMAWEPMGMSVNKLAILRWYPLDLRRNPRCVCCGDREPKLIVT